MKLTIVIVSFNTKELLAKCLQSIEKATKVIETQTFVVDNASSDGTSQDIGKNFPWVKLIENISNLGFSKANNIALKKAQGEYVLILNPDTELMQDSLEKLVDFMDKNPIVSMLTPKVMLPTGKLDRDCRRSFPTPWRAFTHFSGLSKIFPKSKIFDSYYLNYLDDSIQHEIDACEGAFMLTRRKELEKVGFFDEDFFFYGEDLDLCYRFKKLGYKILYTPITKIIHYKGVSSGIKKESKDITMASRQSKKKALRESTRAMKLFYKKHYRDKYPKLVTFLVLATISIIEKLRLARV